LVGLAGPEPVAQGQVLQDLVIRPNADSIVENFYSSLVNIEDFSTVVGKYSDANRLRDVQRRYVSSLGVDFDKREYFEDRLRMGSVHHGIGVPQVMYQCAFQALQFLLIQNIPHSVQRDQSAFERMIQFILRITALDMSLATESYYAARMFGLESSLKTERGERERFHRLAVTDWLTDLHNHSYSRRFLAEALDFAKTATLPLCVVMADLDHFKKINDTHGHLVGDQILRIAAARMVSGARADDEIGRYGGEEFIFILQSTDIVEAKDVAERVRAHISSDAIRGRDAQVNVTLSLGIAQARDSDDVDALIGRADAALYTAKQAGRNCVRIEANE
jgi:diguanylate cyclase (GGDEF)-like protein